MKPKPTTFETLTVRVSDIFRNFADLLDDLNEGRIKPSVEPYDMERAGAELAELVRLVKAFTRNSLKTSSDEIIKVRGR